MQVVEKHSSEKTLATVKNKKNLSRSGAGTKLVVTGTAVWMRSGRISGG